jgi:hypothetical protein
MAISYVGGATGVSVGNTDVSVSLTALTGGSDSAPVDGDLVIFAYNIADADNADLVPACNTAGFTSVADLFGNGTQDANLGVFYKFMTATPDTTVVGEGILGGTDTAIQGAAMAFRGVKPVASGGPFDVASTTATGTTVGDPDPPSIDTTGAAGIWTVIVGACAHIAGTGGTFTGPTNYTTDFITVGNDDTADGIIGMGYNPAPADPENPGLMTTAFAATGWCAVTMALSEASAAAQNLTGSTFTKAGTYPQGALSSTFTLSGTTFTKAGTFPTGALTFSTTLPGSTFQKAPTFPTGVLSSIFTLIGTTFQKAPTFPLGTIETTGGALQLSGVTFTKAPTFPQGALSATFTLTGTTFQKAGTFPSGGVAAGAVTVGGSTFQKAGTFPTGVLSIPGGGGGQGAINAILSDLTRKWVQYRFDRSHLSEHDIEVRGI